MSQGRRTAPLPADWSTIRSRVLVLDGQRCQIRFDDICIGHATEVDHVIPAAQGGTDAPANLQAACRPCHARKTAKEAAAARVAKYNRKRTPEPHPGAIQS